MAVIFKQSNVKNVLEYKLLWVILLLSILFICLANAGNLCNKEKVVKKEEKNTMPVKIYEKPLNQCPSPDKSVIDIITNLSNQLLSLTFEFLSFYDLLHFQNCYDLTNINFFTKFQKRTYGLEIVEYIPHPQGTYFFPTSIKQIAEFPFYSASTAAHMILYHDGRLAVKGFERLEFFENVESLFFFRSLFFFKSEARITALPTIVYLYVSFFDQTMKKAFVLEQSPSSFELMNNEVFYKHELFSLSPSVFAFRQYTDKELTKSDFVVVQSHRFDMRHSDTLRTLSTSFCQYSTIGENKFVVNFDESSKVIESIEINDQIILIDAFLNFFHTNNRCINSNFQEPILYSFIQ